MSNDGATDENLDVCAICREPQMDVQIFGCERPHKFHRTCILQWFERRNVCPVCIRHANITDLRYIVSYFYDYYNCYGFILSFEHKASKKLEIHILQTIICFGSTTYDSDHRNYYFIRIDEVFV